MEGKKILEYAIDELKKQGADKVSCSLSNSEKKELNIEHGEMSLFRTTFNSSLSIEAFIDGKKGSTSINKVNVIGKHIVETYKNIQTRKKGLILKENSQIFDLIQNNINNNDYLMIKGSNSTGLNRLVSSIKKGNINAL